MRLRTRSISQNRQSGASPSVYLVPFDVAA
jgi:hypothetical protein